MAVITISRQYGSGGEEIVDRLCERLGYRLFDKRLVAEAAREAGFAEQEVIDYSEESHKVRSFLDRLFGRTPPLSEVRIWTEDVSGVRRPEEIRLTEEAALALMQKAILSAYQHNNMIIVGRGGQVVLKDKPGVLHVRIEAPMEQRIQHVKERLKEARQEYLADVEIRRQAQDLIFVRDGTSADYLKRFYNVDWADPTLYHVVLNTGKLDTEQAVQVIINLVKVVEAQAAPQA